MSAVEKVEKKVAEDHNAMVLSAIQEAHLEILQLTAKGEEPCSMAKNPGHPGDNWVTEAGGLPTYICNVAKHMNGTTSEKIAQAVSTVKKWAADPHTSADTKAKASAAIADWERKRASAHAHHTVKEAGKLADKSGK